MPGFPATDPPSQARRMVRLARPDPLRPVVVLGPGALGLTLELCRDGFHEVVCGGRTGLPCPHEHSSTVFLGGPATTEELRPLLHDACAVLGGRGRLVARLSGIDQDRTVEALLAECGVRVRTAVYDLSREVLVCHEVEPAAASATPSREGVSQAA